MFVDFNILNQLGSPSINSNTFANRPAAGQKGRLFVSTDTFQIFRDNGTGWDLLGGGGGTITGSGTATQVAYFTGSSAIGSSSNLYWDATNSRLGIATASPGSRLDVHAPGTTGNFIAEFNATNAIGNTYLQFKYQGTSTWRIGNTYNAGNNFYALHNSALNLDAVRFLASNNIADFTAQQTYTTGQAQSALFTYNLTVPNGTNFSTPNVIGAVNSFLNLSLGGNTTMPASNRQGLEGNNRISFTGAGTLTMTQGSTVRAFSALSSVHSFVGSAIGTVTHLAGLRICFPDNTGSSINITNNYGILLNDQTAGTGTVTYSNRWGVYQEGSSDLNYFNGNLLIKSTTNTGQALQVTGTAIISSTITSTAFIPTVASIVTIGMYSPATNVIELATAGTTAIRINATQQVGIFTGAIGSRLQVNGNCAIGYAGSTAAPTNGLQVAGATNLNNLVTLGDAVNIAVNATTGTIIGTATTQKLAFWNKTPIVQPTTAVASATRVGGAGTNITTLDTFGGYTLAQVVQALQNVGILA